MGEMDVIILNSIDKKIDTLFEKIDNLPCSDYRERIGKIEQRLDNGADFKQSAMKKKEINIRLWLLTFGIVTVICNAVPLIVRFVK